MLIDGIHVPVTEPFYRDGALYLRKLEHNIRRYSLSPVSGLVTLPPDGEASTLSDAEVLESLAAVSETAAREKILVAGIAQDSVRGAISRAHAAENAGFDAVLVAAPRNWKSLLGANDLSPISLFFRAVADATSLPVLLYSNAADGAFQMTNSFVGELSKHGNIVGIFEANLTEERRAAIAEATADSRREVEVTTVFAPVTRRMKKQSAAGAATFVSAAELGGGTALATVAPAATVKTRTKNVGFAIMAAGTPRHFVPLLESGVAGAMPTLASCAPQACYEVFAAFKDGDPVLALEKAVRLESADAVIAELGISAVKYGCDLNGYYGGVPRLPRLPLTRADRGRVESALGELKN